MLSPTSWAVEFLKRKIQINNNILSVEIADTDAKREQGLMERTALSKDEGMLFIFSHEKPLGFWMKNTRISLSIGFFDKNKTLIDIQDMEPASILQRSIPVYKSKKPAQYALEVNKGWFKAHSVKLGSRFEYKK